MLTYRSKPILTEINDTDIVSDIRLLLRDYGYVLIRNKSLSVDDFNSISTELCFKKMSYNGGALKKRKNLNANSDKFSYEASGLGQDYPVPLHGEMYYQSIFPDILFFYCEHPPSEGGETLLCDGLDLYHSLSEETKTVFNKNKLLYRKYYNEEEWQQTYGINDISSLKENLSNNGERLLHYPKTNSIVVEFTTSAIKYDEKHKRKLFNNSLMLVLEVELFNKIKKLKYGDKYVSPMKKIEVRFSDGTSIPRILLREIKKAAHENQIKIKWEKDDILIVDNSRMLHGRNATLDKNRNIIVQMGKNN